MRKSLTTTPSQPVEQTTEEVAPPKYSRPKILLLDTPESVLSALRDGGFRIVAGSLGRPYAVERSSGHQQLIGRPTAPNHTEQEIVVVDLSWVQLASCPSGTPERPETELDLWGKCDRGFLDPRVRSAAKLKQDFDRIDGKGGVFVVFANGKTGIETVWAETAWRGGTLRIHQKFDSDEWDFLSCLAELDVKTDSGTEMRVSSKQSPLGRLLAGYLEHGSFSCSLRDRWNKGWQPLAENKFGDHVAMVLSTPKGGWVILLPQLADKAGFLLDLFTTVLPEIAPHLFPDIEQVRWTGRPEYELPKIIELRAEQAAIEEKAKLEIERIESAVQAERQGHHWMHDLLTGTDTCLVNAVKVALGCLGFTKVIDVDEQRDRQSKTRREDLQIDDTRPTLIIDVKGIAGYPSDDDALQADKHATIRIREWNRTDVVGLSIINHQRHIPPLDRENATPFRQELLDAAEVQALGLMTSWDLYRLVRNYQKHGWRGEDVRAVLYRKGRIDAVPQHYQLLGQIAKVWTDKFGVVMKAGSLAVGDRLAVEFPIEFEEATVGSIMVNKAVVQSCSVGDEVGLLWPVEKAKLREGMRVFRCAPAGKLG